MEELILPRAIERSERILVAGAGGGFDVFAGVPVYERLRRLGKRVWLANLSFTNLANTDATHLGDALWAVDATSRTSDVYFPERALARFLESRGDASTIYAFEKTGVAPLRDAYASILSTHAIDAIVLVDGGTDILLRGDECELGTPAEDATSLAAVSALSDLVATKVVMCVGFGIDAYHGVCHSHWLENVAALTREGAFLGAIALRREMQEVQLYLDAVEAGDIATPSRPSIVNGSIASAIDGRFGNHHRSKRTKSSTLFINPLMTLLWAFDLDAVARRNLYLRELMATESVWDVQVLIEAFHSQVAKRPRVAFPH
ncbi:MAG: DUF1152 domain-containing protein [Deltaproteobacteria bacterium]|nr:DUF1152 domain-containing protein [Deltaproteobacteria bacterium]